LNLRNQALAMTVLRAGVVPGAGSSDLDTRLAAANLRRGQLLYKACHDVQAGLPHKVGPQPARHVRAQSGYGRGLQVHRCVQRRGLRIADRC
jgi:cytochrome c2